MELKHAIVGCGRIAPCHAEAFARLPGVKLWSCTDPVQERAAQLAQQFGIAKAVGSFEEVLADPEVTSLSLAVPHDLHAPMAAQALERGKHVLVEKPVCLNPEEGARLLDAARRARTSLVPVVQHRYDPAIQIIRELVASGDLGQIRLVRSHLECFRQPEYYRESDWRGRWAREGGSVLINQAYHLVDLLVLLVGPVESVSANMATFSGPEVMETEDTLVASFVHQKGALGSLTLSGSAGSIWSSYIELIGSGGVLAFDINHPNVIHRLQLNGKRAMQAWKKRFAEPPPEEYSAPPAGAGYYGTSHRLQARAFVEQLRRGDPPGPAALEEALEVVGLIHRIYSAARAGRG